MLISAGSNEPVQQQKPEHTMAVSPLIGFGSPWSLSLFVPFPSCLQGQSLLLSEQGLGWCWEKQLGVEIWRGRGGAGFCLPKGKRQSWECWLPLQGMLPQDASNSYGMKFWEIRDQTGKLGVSAPLSSLILKGD